MTSDGIIVIPTNHQTQPITYLSFQDITLLEILMLWQCHWMLLTHLLVNPNTMFTHSMDLWWPKQLKSIWLKTVIMQTLITDLSFLLEALSLVQDLTHLTGLETTGEIGVTWTTQLLVSWTWICSVSHKLVLMFAVSSVKREMMKCAQDGSNWLLSTHSQELIKILHGRDKKVKDLNLIC